jgi:tRNA A-37 threonylcarbamoyl transferase component Bud32
MDLSAVADGYQLVRPIGRGTTTMVLEAWDRQRRRPVALKVPIQPYAGDEAFLDRLQREVWAVAGFTHTNVAEVHAIERDGQAAFVVVELVDGSSLPDMLAERGPLPPVGAARVAAGACAAAAAAHAHGIVHGHLVPANVLLTIDGRVKVTDFRLAQATLASGGVADPGDDVRALGRCLAAMLTGRELASAETARLPTASPELAAIVARAAGDPHDAEAYRSATELGRDLARFLAAARPGAGGTARRHMVPAHGAPPVTVSRPSRAAGRVPLSAARAPDNPAAAGGAPSGARRRRRPRLLAGLVTAVLVAVGVLIAFGLPDRQPSRLTAGNAVAPPPTAILATTTSPPAGSRAASTAAPSSTRPPTTAAATPSTTSGRGAGTGQRVVPNVVGLHRAQAADVLARAQLGVQVMEVPIPESGKAQRVISQQPSAGQVVPARSDVLLLVGTRRPAG